MREDSRPIYTFGYVDESGTSERYFGCGLLMHGPGVAGRHDHRLNQHILGLKTAAGIRRRGDVGWKKVPSKPGRYLDFYRRCIVGFFRHPRLSFHALVVDTHKYPLDSKAYFQGSKDAGIDAFVFHLVKHRIVRDAGQTRSVYIRYDRRCRAPDQPLSRLSGRLRREVRRRADGSGIDSIRLRSVVGGRHPLVQVSDLLLGCLLACMDTNVRSCGKTQLMELLERRLGRPAEQSTPPWEEKFSVWHFRSS